MVLRFALLLSIAACAFPKPPPSQAPFEDDSAVVVSTDQLATPPFRVLSRVRGKLGTQDIAFDCTVQLSQGKLTLTGMTPYGTRAFLVEQIGSDVHARTFELNDLPFEALQVLVDVHRVFFRGLPQSQTNGRHELVQGDQVVRELWSGGHVVDRRFHSLDTSASLVVISFDGAPAPVIAPRLRLTNLHYNYSLEIENIEQERLRDDYTLTVERKHDP
jgi:hypothetical protein